MFEKYIYINNNEFKASVKQSMSDGLWYCGELTVNGKCREQLKNRLNLTIQDIITILNKYNKDVGKATCLKKVVPKKEKTFPVKNITEG